MIKMSDGFVYFIQEEGTDHIKIGFSEKHPEGRLKDFQTGNSNKLNLLGYIEGTYKDESNLHYEFSEERGSGEWFESSPRLKERIKELLEESLEGKKSGIDDLNFEYKEEEREKGVLYQGFVNEKTVWLKSKNDKIDGNYVFKNIDGGEYVGETEDGVPSLS